MRLIQLSHPTDGRKLALVEEPVLKILDRFHTAYDLATEAIRNSGDIRSLVKQHLSEMELDYDPIYQGHSAWKVLPSFDHPSNPLALQLSGTGLTHKASAENRQKMHEAGEGQALTDSMKIYLMGVEGGRPENGQVGVQPEWFYKGNGTLIRGHGSALKIPGYGDDGGEEPEIAGVYLIDTEGKPWRIGFTTANEFSDHLMERKNYLYLAPSKIRNCAIGPELVIRSDFQSIPGNVSILRQGAVVWDREIETGEANMAHSLSNLEYHHFKYRNHQVPGQAHIHFFGADAFSFGEGFVLRPQDIMQVAWEGMGRPLRNVLLKEDLKETPQPVNYLR